MHSSAIKIIKILEQLTHFINLLNHGSVPYLQMLSFIICKTSYFCFSYLDGLLDLRGGFLKSRLIR